jgi:hypothetical protein
MRSLLSPTLVLLGLVALAPAEDVLQLRDGTSLHGSADTITFSADGKQLSYPRDQVAALVLGATSAAPAQAAPAPAAVAGSSSGAVPAPATPAVLPAGTAILVRMKDALDTKKQGPGSPFEAVLDVDLTAGSTVVAKKGAPVYGVVRSSQQAGRVLGKSELEIGLTGIQVNGKLVPCSTDAAVAAGEGSGRDTARKAGAGALIGAAADGSEGARKGAAVGGAVALMTKGQSVQIPSGSLLQFKLTQPLSP